MQGNKYFPPCHSHYRLSGPWFVLLGRQFSGRDLVLIGGGLFLLAKATHEIHNSLEVVDANEKASSVSSGFLATIIQITLLDIVFSLDSVITAVGLFNELKLYLNADHRQ